MGDGCFEIVINVVFPHSFLSKGSSNDPYRPKNKPKCNNNDREAKEEKN
jgi:hypothetical protein